MLSIVRRIGGMGGQKPVLILQIVERIDKCSSCDKILKKMQGWVDNSSIMTFGSRMYTSGKIASNQISCLPVNFSSRGLRHICACFRHGETDKLLRFFYR